MLHGRKTWVERGAELGVVFALLWPVQGAMSLGAVILGLVYGGWMIWTAMIGYGVLIVLDRAPYDGVGRGWSWVRSWRLWALFGSYFPVSFEAEEHLDPGGRYIFGFHPHGVYTLAAFATFGNDVLGFSSLFPGLRLTVVTLPVQFFIPFYREFLLAIGAAVANKHTIAARLASGPGATVGIVLGGAREALETREGTNNLILARRKGFIKIALRQGASLVPVFGFGQNNLYKPIFDPDTWPRVAKFQRWMLRTTGFVAPLFYGRWGTFIPFRRAVHVVAGPPIHLPTIPEPTQSEIDHYHALYVAALQSLYDRHKDEYLRSRTRSMKVIG